ncbi:MAG: hypothetical protein D6784_13585 [Chloroflexi bacterium]|nr:MAG: hypothetical protein D6784_13585 [Chloroflexota bacterium]
MFNIIARLHELEADIYYREPAPYDLPEYTYLPGRLPVLLSAPHGAAHIRNGKLKLPDEYTASFARLVAERTGAPVLYTHHKSDTDPNYDRESPYKAYLAQIIRTASIRFVIDIHGASPRRHFGIALGTMHGRSCPPHLRQLIIDTLCQFGFATGGDNLHRLDRLDIDNIFPGGEKQHTVTSFVSQTLKIPAAQFELNAYLRTYQPFPAPDGWAFTGDPPRIQRTVNAFVALVQRLSEVLAGE